jgi:ABC-type uncharacterized transport system fused permease/ATPase subunit
MFDALEQRNSSEVLLQAILYLPLIGLGFARVLIAHPKIVVMDEATSALDSASQKELMELINQRLPDATIVGIGHRPELEAFYNRIHLGCKSKLRGLSRV